LCGIIGYKGKQNAFETVFKGLKKLEYRGYDSWGIAGASDGQIHVFKTVGKIKKFPKQLEGKNSGLAISHTRWATHGGVTKENAHPHVSEDGAVAVVHNGIIENYSFLKDVLEKKGHKFCSECDSEVIVHLIEEQLSKGKKFPDAVRETTKQLKGSYAVLALNKKSDELVGVRKESPLVLGHNGNDFFLASDVPAFLEHTKTITLLDEGEMVVVKDKPIIHRLEDGKKVKKETVKVDWDIEQASKGDYKHFMLKEIHEQPQVLKQTLHQQKEKLKDVARLINTSPRVCIVACGTSRHAALVGRYVIAELAKKYCEVYMASEFQYFVEKLGKETLVIAVSQSGETADVLVPVREAKKQGCKVVSLVNVVGSSLDRESDVSLYLNCGPEIAVASTKAFTSQITMFYLLAYTMIYKLDEGKKKLEEIPGKIKKTIQINEEKVKKISDYIKDWDDAYFIARAENFAVAIEGAHKMKEISYVHAEGMPSGELKHGTLALVEKGTPVIAICPKDHTYEETLSNVHETKARGAHIVGISDKPNKLFDEWLEIPDVEYIFYPLLANIPCQLLAYYTAVARNTEVDMPRNLAKSVTVK
jgi:glucosamine--fructose-6-phosphate aminotransferase (isomerizing)